MNQNDARFYQNAAPGQRNNAESASPAAWPAAGSPSGMPQNMQTYPQSGQSYMTYPQTAGQNTQPGYQAPKGYQISAAHAPEAPAVPGSLGYQTPQVTGNQPPVQNYQNTASSAYAGAYTVPSFQIGGYIPTVNYPQNGAYAPNQNAAPQGYYQGQIPSYPQGGYMPQSQNPYAVPQGYGMPGYQQGNPSYTQMGRQPASAGRQDFAGQMPLNGGGYVPQPVPVRRRPFEMKDSYLLIFGGLLLVFFALGMFFNGGIPVLKYIFLALAVLSSAALWIRPLTDRSKRLCYTVVFALLSVITVISLFQAPSSGSATTVAPGAEDPTRVSSSLPAENPYSPSGGMPSVTSSVTNTPEPEPDNSVTERLQTFFYYWSANRYDDMLTLCSPVWQSKVENPKTALFALMANRTPKDYSVENVSGTEQDTSRTVTVTSLMDRNNGKDPVRYRLSVIMMKESDGSWYVDPQSLQTYEAADTPDPSVTATPGPTETPAIYANTILYYNPSGGEFYHLDQNCKRINERYLPLQGHFTYAELGNDPYNKLKPCAICGAPSRQP